MRGWKPPRAHALRGLKRSRGTGPRATVSGTASLTVGRGPVPRQAPIARDRPSRYGGSGGFRLNRRIARDRPSRYGGSGDFRLDRRIAGDRPSRYGDREIAGGTHSDARVASEGPRAPFISFSSPHRTSSASDLTQKPDPATAASLTSPVSHQTQLPQSDSNTQHPASQTCR